MHGEAESSSCRQRILVVDDHRDTTEFLAILLGSHGHTVEVAHDATGALEVAAAFGPTVAILDLGLAGEDGIEVALRLRGELPRVRLLAATGRAEPEVAERCLDAGFEDVLVKPVDPDALLRLLETVAAD